jgi:selenocysteine lyase/cysteine desulfurase
MSARLADALEDAGLAVTRLPPRFRSHIIAATPRAGDAQALHAGLAASDVRCSYRKGALRLSVHAYTSEAEIDRAAEVVRTWCAANR